MKMKYLLAVGLILAILTIGAVSASDDVASDANLTAEDSIAESEVLANSHEDVLAYDESDYDCSIPDELTLDYGVEYDHDDVVSFESYNKDLTGSFKVYINNDLKYTKNIASDDYYEYGEDAFGYSLSVTPKDLGWTQVGTHAVKVTLNNQILKQKNLKITLRPGIRCPNMISVGESETTDIYVANGLSGNVKISIRKYDEINYEYVKYLSADVKVNNGHGSFSLADLPEGEYDIDYIFGFGNFDSQSYSMDVVKNSPGFSSKVSPTSLTAGSSVNVKVTGPRNMDNVTVFVDNRQYRSLAFVSGKISCDIKGLALGTHKIRVCYDDGATFYSNTYYVSVKAKEVVKLTLKKVKVKKSAKKLVLTATLKINKKAVKGKIIKFKFNKKTLKAKTNKKGVAKVVVKKSLLKRLKVGKKVTYSATYAKKTVKKTVKVLK